LTFKNGKDRPTLGERLLSFILVIALLVLCGLVFLWTTEMTPGAELFPRIMAATLGGFGAVELLRSRFSSRGREAAGAAGPESGAVSHETNGSSRQLARRSAMHMGAFFLLVIAFLALFPVAGFEIAAFLLMLGGMVLLGGLQALRLWIVAIAVPLVLVFIFRLGLGVRLPTLPFLE
jgi:hypothetical protein